MTILDDIIAYKIDEVAAAKSNTPASSLEALATETTPPRGFETALRKASSDGIALIAEIKKASPSKGLIREQFDAARHAQQYETGGATCLSVLTDSPSFKGQPSDLRAAREASRLSILRKDFMVDPYQVIEARAWGSDAILVIMACTSDALARELMAAASSYDLDVLVETHNEAEMERAVALNASLIGVNNRDLTTFQTDLGTTARLASLAPSTALLVAESGISSAKDIEQLKNNGAGAFLVGETLMRQPDLTAATQELIAVTPSYSTA
ncbi:MAG: indole-3-glycerol phosphate synthase TrpC [Pseudomonadota bacterium]